MSRAVVAAVDLGASSGRVILGRVGGGELRLEECHRFANEPVTLPDGLRWDALRLQHEILVGLREAAARAAREGEHVASIGIDTWAVDFGLLDRDGGLIGNPFHYRDPRTARGVDRVHALIPRERLYARNGLQVLPFNTLYQLAAWSDSPVFGAADRLLLMPDLLAYWLSGRIAAERTNASTTGLLDARTRVWDTALIEELGWSPGLFPELIDPGTSLGPILPSVAAATGLPRDAVITAVGSHDTASAVVAIPADGDAFAYISCGTWSLVGVEIAEPILTEASRAANFTNEGGVDGRIRYLRNVMGLWLLQESMRAWEREGTPEDLGELLQAAAAMPAGGPTFDPDLPSLLAPGDMPHRIHEVLHGAGEPSDGSRPALVRSILDSLATAYARTVSDAVRLSGRSVEVVHLVGGGSHNELLCRLTADASGLPVIAGPAEATALGNILVQARALGMVSGDLGDLRALVRSMQPLRRYEPGHRAAGTVG